MPEASETSQKSLETSKVAANVFVYYEGHLSSYPNIMVGKLILNSRYLIFHIYEPRYTGVLQTARLNSTGRVLSLGLNTIMDVTVESGSVQGGAARTGRTRTTLRRRAPASGPSTPIRASSTMPRTTPS